MAGTVKLCSSIESRQVTIAVSGGACRLVPTAQGSTITSVSPQQSVARCRSVDTEARSHQVPHTRGRKDVRGHRTTVPSPRVQLDSVDQRTLSIKITIAVA
jgi:hypothetical protein